MDTPPTYGEYDNGKQVFILSYPDEANASKRYKESTAKLRAMSRYGNYAEQDGIFHMQDDTDKLISLTNRGKYLVVVVGCESPAAARDYLESIHFRGRTANPANGV